MKNSTIILPALLFIASFTANAQSLPNVQKVSVRAPANIKIDGKANEWDDKFQAYNHATDVFYTLSNDDEKLYLTIRAPYPNVCEKVLLGGITLTISRSTDTKTRKKDITNKSILFPVPTGMSYSRNLMPRADTYINSKKDAIIHNKQLDSLFQLINQKAANSFKEIQVNGIKDIKDQRISVYNIEGIQAIGQFNKSMDFIYELAIPLKYLEFSIDGSKTFSYNIRLNGYIDPMVGTDLSAPKVTVIPGVIAPKPIDPSDRDLPTDFWGEYTLAKK